MSDAVSRALAALVLVASAAALAADDARVLRWGSPLVEAAEEAFILAGRDPPLLERPVLAGRLREELLGLEGSEAAAELAASLEPPAKPWSLGLSTSLYGAWNGSPSKNASFQQLEVFDKAHYDPADPSSWFVDVDKDADPSNNGENDRRLFSTEAMGPALAAPPLLEFRLGLFAGPVALDFDPELRPSSNWYREADSLALNYGVLAEPGLFDINVPYRGIATFLRGPFEFRMGRDKLHFGPARDTGLSFNAAIPWADFASARVDAGPLSFSAYIVRLNPYMTDSERYFLDAIYEHPDMNPDSVAYYELIHGEAEKNIAVCRLTWKIAPWATLVLTQHDMVGGRSMQLSDFNPLLIWHNLFQEGVYGVPAMVELSCVPLRGLRLYGEYLLYDAVVADETDSGTDNAGASAYLAGLSAVLPAFGSGFLAGLRLRLDAEATLTDPWVYGKSLTLRQFTSRFVFVESHKGRFWVDYPIGPEFGPDTFDLDLRMGLGKPGGWELALRGGLRYSGSIDLLGYGEGSDYSHQSDYRRSGLVFVKEGEEAERRVSLGLEGHGSLGDLVGLSFEAVGALGLVWCDSYGCVPGDDRSWFSASLALKASNRP